MVGTAVVSLDCEGKWGVADKLQSSHAVALSDERLRWAYLEVCETLRQSSVSATFAVVEMFTWTREAQTAGPLRELASELSYLGAVPEAIAAGDEGWSAPWLLEHIGSAHEIASHGFSHTPWTRLTPSQAARELELTAPERRRTLVFPRNRVAHTNMLPELGCEGFRSARGATSRVASLLSEFDLGAPAEADPPMANPQQIPAGYFINWRSGARRLVPPAVTRARARRILSNAAATGGVAHFWTHPENIATHPRTLFNFKNVIEEIARARDAGRIRVLTQIEYCRSRAT